MPKKNEPEISPKPYVESGNIEAQLKEFKEVTKERLNKLESWIIAIVGLTFTTLVTTVVGLLMKLL